MKDNTLLVKIKDWDRTLSYQLMTQDEYKKLQKRLKLENGLKAKAFRLATKEWKAKEEYKGKSYPRSVMKIKTARVVKSYKDHEKAEDKLFKLEEKIQEKIEEEEDEKKHGERRLRGKARIKADKEYAKQAARDLMMQEARDLFMAKVESLKAPEDRLSPEELEAEKDEPAAAAGGH